MCKHSLSDVDRAMTSAGAAETDDELCFSTFGVDREQKIDEPEKVNEERLERRITFYKCGYLRVHAGLGLELRIVVWILQEAYVEKEIQIRRRPELKAKSEKSNVQALT